MPAKKFKRTKKWERAVKHIKKSGGVSNPYAVATAAIKKSRAKRKRKRK